MSTARSTARRRSCRPTWSAPSSCWTRRARIGPALPADRRAAFRFHHVSTDEVFGALGARRRAVHRGHRLRSAQPLCRQQGGLGPPGAGLVPHLRPAGHRLQHLQQLRPLAVSRKADPAGHASTRWRASRCRSTATAPTGATGCSSRTMPPPWCACWSAASPAPPTRSAPASRAATSRWCARSAPRSTGCGPTRPARASG